METQKMMNTEAIAPIVIAVAAKMIGDGVCDDIFDEGGFFGWLLNFLSKIFGPILDLVDKFINLEDLAKKVCKAFLSKNGLI